MLNDVKKLTNDEYYLEQEYSTIIIKTSYTQSRKNLKKLTKMFI